MAGVVALVLFLVNLLFGGLWALVYSDEAFRPDFIIRKCACGLVGFLILLTLLRNVRMTDLVKRRVFWGVLCYVLVLGLFYITAANHVGILVCDAARMHRSALGTNVVYHLELIPK
jgi:hypothetical protein